MKFYLIFFFFLLAFKLEENKEQKDNLELNDGETQFSALIAELKHVTYYREILNEKESARAIELIDIIYKQFTDEVWMLEGEEITKLKTLLKGYGKQLYFTKLELLRDFGLLMQEFYLKRKKNIKSERKLCSLEDHINALNSILKSIKRKRKVIKNFPFQTTKFWFTRYDQMKVTQLKNNIIRDIYRVKHDILHEKFEKNSYYKKSTNCLFPQTDQEWGYFLGFTEVFIIVLRSFSEHNDMSKITKQSNIDVSHVIFLEIFESIDRLKQNFNVIYSYYQMAISANIIYDYFFNSFNMRNQEWVDKDEFHDNYSFFFAYFNKTIQPQEYLIDNLIIYFKKEKNKIRKELRNMISISEFLDPILLEYLNTSSRIFINVIIAIIFFW